METKGTFARLYTDRASHFVHTPVAGEPPSRASRSQVEQVLDELGIELVVAHSPEARGRSERMFGTLQGRLPLELRRAGVKTYADAADVYVEVADSGRGIPKDRLQHIFEPNFAQKDARVGLSLGLATSYNIVRKHQGFLRLESEIDKGTIVTIVLPIKSN